MPTKTTPKRTFRHPDDRRRELMDAAVSLFARKGLAETTVADITAHAGMSKGSFYLSFGSKEELLGALKQGFADEIVSRTEELYAQVGSIDFWEVADAMVDAVVAAHYDHPDLVHVLARESLTPQAAAIFGEAGRRVQTMITQGIEAGVAQGAFSCSDPSVTAGLLMHAIDGVIQHAFLYENAEVTRARVAAAAKELVRKALGPPA